MIVGIGGIAGRIAARRDFGYLLGGLIGTLLAAVSLALIGCVIRLDWFPQALAVRYELRTILGIAALIGGVMGGILGGIFARIPERRRLKR